MHVCACLHACMHACVCACMHACACVRAFVASLYFLVDCSKILGGMGTEEAHFYSISVCEIMVILAVMVHKK